MAIMKAGLATIGAVAVATMLVAAPIAAQVTGPPREGSGDAGSPGRRGIDPNDPDITGPRGAVGLCQERISRAGQRRIERIQRLTRPTDEQRAAFDELRMASAKAVDILRSACPAEWPLTPTARLAAAETRLEARLLAIKTVRPALESFYKLLSDEQKARWITAPWLADRWGDGPKPWQHPGWGRGDAGRGDADRDRSDRDAHRWGDRDRQDGSEPRRDRGDSWRDRWREWHDRFYGDRWRDGGGFGEDRWHDLPGHERRREWHDHFGERRLGPEGERGDNRGRDDERGDWRQPDRWHDQDRWHEPRSPERGRSADPQEERL